jgi:hypothetical protein
MADEEKDERQAARDKQREEEAKRWPRDVEGEGRQAAADQDVGPESTPSRGES